MYGTPSPSDGFPANSRVAIWPGSTIGLSANLFYSKGIPVCILVLNKCKKQETCCSYRG
jgi:hypothetical protein